MSIVRDGAPLVMANALHKRNKPGGFACISCAWAKPAKPHLAEWVEADDAAQAADRALRPAAPQRGRLFPECNPLITVQHHADKSHVPAAKNIPVRVERALA